MSEVIHVEVDGYRAVVEGLAGDGWEMCLDVTCVDQLTNAGRVLPDDLAPERFELVVVLLSFARRARTIVKVQVPADNPVVPSITDLYPGADAAERETFDLFGIIFDGHPDLTRILMPEDWEGHPLRKDYGVGTIPVQFKAAPAAR